jgi:hypothetical protein
MEVDLIVHGSCFWALESKVQTTMRKVARVLVSIANDQKDPAIPHKETEPRNPSYRFARIAKQQNVGRLLIHPYQEMSQKEKQV